MHHRTAAGLLFVAFVLANPCRTAAEPCVGDCNGDGRITINEILEGVDGLLSNTSRCDALDEDDSGSIEVNEIVAAIDGALNGCPPRARVVTPSDGTRVSCAPLLVAVAMDGPVYLNSVVVRVRYPRDPAVHLLRGGFWQ